MSGKKKILYIVRYQLDKEFNLKQKFDGQIRSFENLGFDAYYLGFDSKHFYLIGGGKKEIVGKTHFGVPAYIHTLYYHDLYTLARKFVKKYAFDYVYWRSSPHCYASCQLAKYISKTDTKLVYEYPTYPVHKEKQMSVLRSLYTVYSTMLGNKVDNLADCFVLIGEDAHGTYKGKPAFNISNGINLECVKLRNRKTDPDTVHLLALASMCYWHGYDRLIHSLAQYQGQQNVMIHMVGGNDGGILPEWKALVQKLGLEDKVLFHGQKTGAELDEMFDLCDLGVNSMGLYRKDFATTSELKVREYAARGLPFLCAVQDPALLNAEEPMWMWITNDDSIPDMQAIVDFALQMRSDNTIANKLRTYAKEHMTWESQYKKIFQEI